MYVAYGVQGMTTGNNKQLIDFQTITLTTNNVVLTFVVTKTKIRLNNTQVNQQYITSNFIIRK